MMKDMSPSVRDQTQRYESNMRARAYLGKAIGMALYSGRWPQYVELVAGSTFLPELQKSTVAAGTTYDASFAAPLTDMRLFSAAFLELVSPRTVVGRLAGVMKAPANVLLPTQTGDEIAFDWVGEVALGQLSTHTQRFSGVTEDVVHAGGFAHFLKTGRLRDYCEPPRS